MSIRFQHCRGHGKEFAIVYFFGKAGDALPVHRHEAPEFHDVTCVKGEVRLVLDGMAVNLTDGMTICFDNAKRHTVIAREPSITIHRYLNGRPDFYDTLKEEECSGELDGNQSGKFDERSGGLWPES